MTLREHHCGSPFFFIFLAWHLSQIECINICQNLHFGNDVGLLILTDWLGTHTHKHTQWKPVMNVRILQLLINHADVFCCYWDTTYKMYLGMFQLWYMRRYIGYWDRINNWSIPEVAVYFVLLALPAIHVMTGFNLWFVRVPPHDTRHCTLLQINNLPEGYISMASKHFDKLF